MPEPMRVDAFEIHAVVGQPGVEGQLAQPHVHLVVVDLAFGDLQGAIHQRSAQGSGDFHVAIQVAGGPVDIRDIQSHQAQLVRVGVQLAFDGHGLPGFAGSLRHQRPFDGADIAGRQPYFAADGGSIGIEGDESGADLRVIDATARELV